MTFDHTTPASTVRLTWWERAIIVLLMLVAMACGFVLGSIYERCKPFDPYVHDIR